MPGHQLTVAEGGVSARIQLRLLLGYASASRLFGRRGLQRFSWTLGKIFPRCNSVVLSEGERRYKIYLRDGYYTHLLYRGFAYEPEIESVLDRTISERTAFIDCGANNGYWSIYAGLKVGHPERVVAIEATSHPFARLQENSQLNNNSFRVMKKAVYSKPHLSLQFATHPQRHAENACSQSANDWSSDPCSEREEVQTITIDEVCDRILSDEGAIDQIVVKIDVEGAEIEAFQGAQKTIDRGALLLYEDHGFDQKCRNTDFLLNQLRLPVYLLHEAARPTRIKEIGELVPLKTNPQVGYNLIAGRPGSPILEKALRVT